MKDNRFPSKEYLENKEVMAYYHNFEDPSIFKSSDCKKCKGHCCKMCGCAYFVEDFEDLSFESLKKELEKETISITSVLELDKIRNQVINSPVLFLRTRNRKREIVDLFSEKTRCSLLTPDGCPYSFEERPLGAIMLLPSYKNGKLACESLELSNEIALENWKKHQEALKKLVEYYTGKSVNERLKEEIKNAIGLLAMSIRNNRELQERQLQVLEAIQYLNQELVEDTNEYDLKLCKKFSLLLNL